MLEVMRLARKGDETVKKILDFLMRRGEAGVTEIARAIGKDKSTVYHHLKKLEREGIVEKTEEGLYRVKFRGQQRIVLEALRKVIIEEAERNGEKIRGFISVEIGKVIDKASEMGVSNAESVLDYLISAGYVEKDDDNTVILMPLGAAQLKVCPICLDDFKDEDEILRITEFTEFGEIIRYMIHLRCHRYAIEQPVFDEYSTDKEYAYCSYCGLPLERELFLELCIPKITPEDLIEHLTDEEIIAFGEDPHRFIVIDHTDEPVVLVTYEDVKEFVAGLYALIEEGIVSQEKVKELKEREDIKRRAAQLYKVVQKIKNEYIKKANDIFDQLLNPIGRACNIINTWWHRHHPLVPVLVNPDREIYNQNLVIKTKEGYFHPYCYEQYKNKNKLK